MLQQVSLGIFILNLSELNSFLTKLTTKLSRRSVIHRSMPEQTSFFFSKLKSGYMQIFLVPQFVSLTTDPGIATQILNTKIPW